MTKKKKILLIDDDENDIELIRRVFSGYSNDFNLDTLDDGTQVGEYMRNNSYGEDIPVFIIVDRKMPKIDGLEVLRLIRNSEKYKYIPVVVFSSSNYDKDIKDSYIYGANAYVIKPIQTEEFNNTVRNIMLFWGYRNENL